MVLVVAEQRGGKLNRATWEAIAAAQQAGGPVKVALLGSGLDAPAAELAAADVAEVIVVDSPALEEYTADGYVAALAAPHRAGIAVAGVPAAHLSDARFRAGAGRQARPRARDRRRRPSRNRTPAITYVRPVFQGKLNAEVEAAGPAPHFVTFQIGAFRADAAARGAAPAPLRKADVTIDAGAIRQKPEAPFKEAKQAVDLSQAERIVAVGRGIKAQEHLKIAEQLAQAMGAELAASRPICDAGWLPMDRQIGSSGQTVAPKLYVALGISGAIQHLVGMKGSRTIVAINKDPEAPIFEIADFGIVGDLFEIVPAMIAELNK